MLSDVQPSAREGHLYRLCTHSCTFNNHTTATCVCNSTMSNIARFKEATKNIGQVLNTLSAQRVHTIEIAAPP